jgi:hypothetical protein
MIRYGVKHEIFILFLAITEEKTYNFEFTHEEWGKMLTNLE